MLYPPCILQELSPERGRALDLEPSLIIFFNSTVQDIVLEVV
jgi:hypothetical protein